MADPHHIIFHNLNPDLILGLVEESCGVRCTNLCRPFNSYINRVYELETKDGRMLVVKFYRPGRWSEQAVQDEHDFLLELQDEEIPVIAPLTLVGGGTVGRHEGMCFAVFPKKGGRSVDEFSEEQWLELGRLLARVHNIGALHKPVDRVVLDPEHATRAQVAYLLDGGFMAPDHARQFADLTTQLIEEISPLFADSESIRIHGDCHAANLIYRPDESFYLIDFDDMVTGPPVQDFWMLLPGPLDEVWAEVDFFLEGYTTFRDFDHASLRLIEPLRAMRFIHYMAWCAHQVAEDGLSLVMPDFGTHHYWEGEIRDCADQLARIRSQPRQFGNLL